jgi:transcriptional regulator with XRE-family HTH domain
MALSDRIMGAREARGWTREQLAVYSNVSVSTIGRIERDEMKPRAASVLALAMALGVAPDDFAAEAGIVLVRPV